MTKGDRRKFKADPDDGTTPVANLLLEALVIAELTGKERAAILFLIRCTYGWFINGKRQKSAKIPLSIWAKALQIEDKARVSKILRSLENKKIIARRQLDLENSYTYTVNTDIAGWNKCIDLQLLSEMTSLALLKRTRGTLSKKTTPSGTNSASPKESYKDRYLYHDNLFRSNRKYPSDDPDKYIKGKYGHLVRR